MRTSGFLPKFRGKTYYFQLAFVHHLLFFYRDLEVSGRQCRVLRDQEDSFCCWFGHRAFALTSLGHVPAPVPVSFPCSLPALPIKTHWRYEGLFSMPLYNLKYVGVSVCLENAGAAASYANQGVLLFPCFAVGVASACVLQAFRSRQNACRKT